MWQAGGVGSVSDPARRAAINRLVYRSKQRGFLELDILVASNRRSIRGLPLLGSRLTDFGSEGMFCVCPRPGREPPLISSHLDHL